MGVVYGAWDELLDRPVALKELRFGRYFTQAALEREGRALAAVHHPNVVTLYGLDLEGGTPRLVMEWVEGSTLEQTLTRGRVHLDRALELLTQIAAGLDAIHRAEVVHGDVRPANVLVDSHGLVKLVDFGLVATLDSVGLGDVIGTPAYVPPEWARGTARGQHAGARRDVDSFAVLCFEVLTGRRPFVASSGEDLAVPDLHDGSARASYVSDLGGCFDDVLTRALARSPDDRPSSCGALVSALRRARDGTDVHGRSLRVLVADDDAEFRATLTALLGRGLRGATIAAASLDAALSAVALEPPDVAFIDLSISEERGLELARALHSRKPKAEIILLAGFRSVLDWQAARALGARHFLLKPAEESAIFGVVEQTALRARVLHAR